MCLIVRLKWLKVSGCFVERELLDVLTVVDVPHTYVSRCVHVWFRLQCLGHKDYMYVFVVVVVVAMLVFYYSNCSIVNP